MQVNGLVTKKDNENKNEWKTEKHKRKRIEKRKAEFSSWGSQAGQNL